MISEAGSSCCSNMQLPHCRERAELCPQCFSLVSLPASLRGMWDRTVSIGSAGKTFSVTGWKVSTPTHLFVSPSLSLCNKVEHEEVPKI